MSAGARRVGNSVLLNLQPISQRVALSATFYHTSEVWGWSLLAAIIAGFVAGTLVSIRRAHGWAFFIGMFGLGICFFMAATVSSVTAWGSRPAGDSDWTHTAVLIILGILSIAAAITTAGAIAVTRLVVSRGRGLLRR